MSNTPHLLHPKRQESSAEIRNLMQGEFYR